MNPRTKKILKITAVVLGVVFIGLAIYYLFFKKGASAPTTAVNENILGQETISPETKNRLVPITDESVLSAAIGGETGTTTSATNIINYVAWDGTINQIDFSGGSKNKIGAAAVERIGEVTASKNGGLFALKYSSSSGSNKYLVYDVQNKNLKSLPENTVALTLSPDGQKIAAAATGAGGTKITLTGIDGSKPIDLAITKIPDLILNWYSDNSIALKTKPSGLAYGLLYSLDLKTKKTSRILGNAYGLTSSFSPSGKKVLISQTESSGFNPSLSVINLDKKNQAAINQLTLPEKCSWAQDDRTVFCSIIKTEDDYIMPDDYYKRKVKSNGEDIIKINLDTGQVQKIIDGVFDASNLFLAPDETYLFFINKIDGRLYRLTL